jgi:hypothetical protein
MSGQKKMMGKRELQGIFFLMLENLMTIYYPDIH